MNRWLRLHSLLRALILSQCVYCLSALAAGAGNDYDEVIQEALPDFLPKQSDSTESERQSSSVPTITWAINPGPPFHIVAGPLQGEGFCDALVDTLQGLLPQYQHKKVLVPQGRVLEFLSAPNSQMCFPCMIKRTVPPKGVTYTASTHQFPRHVLITRASLMHSTTPIELKSVLSSNKYRYGYPQGRRYGVLDPLLEAYKTDYPELVLARAGPGEADSVLSLIEIGRIDFTIDYPMVLKYHRLVSAKEPLVALKMLPITENQQEPPQNAVGCANNAWGLDVVDNINGVIPQLKNSAKFQQAKTFWLEEQP